MSPQELRAEALKKTEAAGALLKKAEEENRSFTDDEETLFNQLHDDAKALKVRSATLEQQASAETELRQIPEAAKPANVAPNDKPDNTRAQITPGQSVWRDYGEFLVAVRRAFDPDGVTARDPMVERLRNQDAETRAATGMEAGVPSEGGFLVPQEFSTDLMERSIETGLLASRCTPQPMSGGKLQIPCVNETSRADGSRQGGVRAYWLSEAAQITASQPAFGAITLEPNWLSALIYCTDELLEDATALAAWMNRAVPDELAFKIDDAIVNGTGAGQPLGIMNANAMVSVSKESGQNKETIVPQNIVKMYARLEGRARRGSTAAWFINQDCLPQLFLMSLTVGTGGGPVFMPAGGLSGLPYNTILGLPVVEIEQCQTLGTTGDIVLGDLSQYLLAQRRGLDVASSIHIRFDYSETAYRFRMRLDGQPSVLSALTPFKGSNTISPFVKLNTRA